MKEKLASISMMAASVPIVGHGIELLIRGVTTMAAFLTVLFGAGIGALGFFCGAVWWRRRLQYQKENARLDIQIRQCELERLKKGLSSGVTPDDSKDEETET